MNTNAYIVVKFYKGNPRCEGYPLSKTIIIKALGISLSLDEWNIVLYRSAELLKKMMKKRIYFLANSMEFMMLLKSLMEIANFAFVMIVALKIFSYPLVNVKALVKEFMYNA
jgi:hypothetical protein